MKITKEISLKASKKIKNLLQVQIRAEKIPKKLSKSSYGFSMSDQMFVGLPATGLKGKWIQLIVEPDGPAAIAPVGHVGPWNGGGWKGKYDDRYWIGRKRPKAESGKDLKGRKTNRTGLQISAALWNMMGLGMKRSTIVRWQFVPPIKNKKVLVVKGKKRLRF